MGGFTGCGRTPVARTRRRHQEAGAETKRWQSEASEASEWSGPFGPDGAGSFCRLPASYGLAHRAPSKGSIWTTCRPQNGPCLALNPSDDDETPSLALHAIHVLHPLHQPIHCLCKFAHVSFALPHSRSPASFLTAASPSPAVPQLCCLEDELTSLPSIHSPTSAYSHTRSTDSYFASPLLYQRTVAPALNPCPVLRRPCPSNFAGDGVSRGSRHVRHILPA